MDKNELPLSYVDPIPFTHPVDRIAPAIRACNPETILQKMIDAFDVSEVLAQLLGDFAP